MKAMALAVLVSSAASAQVAFSDDFETGTLTAAEVPAGKWSSLFLPVTTDVLSTSPMAARAGTFGLRLVDATGGTGSTALSGAELNIPAYSGDLTLTFWMRVVATNNSGTVFPAIIHGTVTSSSIAEVGLISPGPTVTLQGRDLTGAQTQTPTSLSLDGGWHLFELKTVGVGTDAGVRSLTVDGTPLVTESVDWSGVQLVRFELGEGFGSRSWLGTLDFDDVSATANDGAVDAGSVDGGSMADGGAADAGTEAPSRRGLQVGCDCGTAPPSVWVVGWLLLVLRRTVGSLGKRRP